MTWQDTLTGAAAVAKRDQFLAELADVTRDAQLVFVIAAPPYGDEPAVLVRGLCGVSDDDPRRAEIVERFLLAAARELDAMFEQLEAVA